MTCPTGDKPSELPGVGRGKLRVSRTYLDFFLPRNLATIHQTATNNSEPKKAAIKSSILISPSIAIQMPQASAAEPEPMPVVVDHLAVGIPRVDFQQCQRKPRDVAKNHFAESARRRVQRTSRGAP